MSSYRSVEEALLWKVDAFLRAASGSGLEATAVRFDILEAVASRLGGFSLRAYQKAFSIQPSLTSAKALGSAEELLALLRSVSIHPSLALAALARRPTSQAQRRRAGEYYTDFRLATGLAESLSLDLSRGGAIVDPAAGTGILLVACILRAAGEDRIARADLLRNRILAADLSSEALRSARLTLASLTDDLEAIAGLNARLICWDSLVATEDAWNAVLPDGPVVVVANPPWEKVKLSRHEYLILSGEERHYGAEYGADFDHEDYQTHRDMAASYGDRLTARYHLLGSGEPDLYKAFVELSTRLAQSGGTLGVIVPAGLIRSRGTEDLRAFLMSCSASLEIHVVHNRARFFAIDSRFKFLLLRARVRSPGTRSLTTLTLNTTQGTANGTTVTASVPISVTTLRRLRPDLTIPEVNSARAWKLFRYMSATGHRWASADSPWAPQFAREVDMTRARRQFTAGPASPAYLPVIEGRMVQQYRFGAKAYHSGTGRRARWDVLVPGSSEVRAQHWLDRALLPEDVRARTEIDRVGFCDVTGQTNERSMLASFVPAGVVCGNKVPTIVFGDGTNEHLPYLWLGIVNSFAFDWLLRRVITTSVNYFLLTSVPVPHLTSDALPARRMADAARRLVEMDHSPLEYDPWVVAELRASIEALVMVAYGLAPSDLAMMLQDFPLLDRGQPAIEGESRSTITRDLVLARATELVGMPDMLLYERVAIGRSVSARPFVSSETALRGDSLEQSDSLASM